MLTAADSVLIPIQCEYYALEGLSQLLNTVKLVQRNFNPALAIDGVLLTMYDARLNLSKQVADERSEEHTSDSSHSQISYAVFCLKKKKTRTLTHNNRLI